MPPPSITKWRAPFIEPLDGSTFLDVPVATHRGPLTQGTRKRWNQSAVAIADGPQAGAGGQILSLDLPSVLVGRGADQSVCAHGHERAEKGFLKKPPKWCPRQDLNLYVISNGMICVFLRKYDSCEQA